MFILCVFYHNFIKYISLKPWAGLNGAIFPCLGQDPCLLYVEAQENQLKMSKKSITPSFN